MALDDLIATGSTAEVYAWNDGHILKLFRDWVRPDEVAYEARTAAGFTRRA